LLRKKKSIKFLDETGYLMASPANKVALIDGIKQVENGRFGKTIKTNDLWK
jgi:hypothetical protein